MSLFSLNALAETAKEKEIKDFLNKQYPNLGVSEVTYIPEVKLYEVRHKAGTAPAYTNETSDFFVIGNTGVQIVNPKTRVNITKDRDNQRTLEIFSKLPMKESITYKFGSGEKHIAIFSDPDCSYCKKLDKEVFSKLTNQNVTIHYFMNPLTTLHPYAMAKAEKIWCSPNPAQSWKDYTLTGKLPANDNKCANPVKNNKALAVGLGLNRTPTLMFDNGIVWQNYLSGEQIIELMNKPPKK